MMLGIPLPIKYHYVHRKLCQLTNVVKNYYFTFVFRREKKSKRTRSTLSRMYIFLKTIT